MSAERTRPQSRRNSVTLTGSFFRRSIENVNNKTKVFGVFTLLTAAIVVGMSIYVVHYKVRRRSTLGSLLLTRQCPCSSPPLRKDTEEVVDRRRRI